MLLSDLMGKEVVNLIDGARLGVVGDSDLVIDVPTGEIVSIVLPNRGRFFNLFGDAPNLVIPWEAIRKIGSQVIIVELQGALRTSEGGLC